MQKDAIIQDIRLKTKDPRNVAFIFGLWFMFYGLLIAGCAEQQKYQSAEPLLTKNINKLQAMEIGEDVLVKMHFTIEKANNEIGYIRTKPLSGAKPFEFWRSDNVGSDNQLLSDLHSIRRIAELQINEQDDGLFIDCNVKIHRLSLPERNIRSSAHAYDLVAASGKALQNIQISPEQKADMTWIDLGKDEQLAAEILKRIEKRIVSQQTVSKKI
jgi:hypothetical protein